MKQFKLTLKDVSGTEFEWVFSHSSLIEIEKDSILIEQMKDVGYPKEIRTNTSLLGDKLIERVKKIKYEDGAVKAAFFLSKNSGLSASEATTFVKTL